MGRRPAALQGDTLKNIREAAFALFGQYGYDGVSMLTVAQAAGITKAALYWHYDGKQALYTDCMHRLNALFRAHVFERMQAESEPGARLMAIFEGLTTLMTDPKVQQGVAGYWLQPATAEVAEARAAQARFEEVSGEFIATALSEAEAAGVLDLQIPAEDMAHTIIATMEAIVLPLRRNTPERSRTLIGALAYSFFRAHACSPEWAHEALGIADAARQGEPVAG